MKKIVFLNDWGDSPFAALERYKRQTPGGRGIWNEIAGVVDLDDADYFVVFDGFPTDEFYDKIPLGKVLFFQREPEVIKPVNKYFENALFFGSYKNHHHLSTWQLIEDFNELVNRKPRKTKILSTVTSGKSFTEGQKRRLEIIHELSKTMKGFDIYGKGLMRESLGAAYKGELNYNGICKLRGLEDYSFTLAFENSSYKNYFTEKIIDSFLTWTKPIYWGAENISEFFPDGSFVFIDIFDKNVIDIILKEIRKPVNLSSLEEARKRVLFQYNLWSAIEKIINQKEKKKYMNVEEKYYSQIGQDKILDTELFNKMENGFYVEVGATDGFHFSNTLFFEKFRNWDGICIEPNPIEFNKLENSGRKCIKENVAVTMSDGEADFLVIEGYGKGLSGIVNNYNERHISRIEIETQNTQSKKSTVKVKTSRLSKIFEKYNIKSVDYCSIDVEGSEFEVIKSIDFSKVFIKCFTIENNYGIDDIKKYLEANGYVHWKTIQWDEVFVHKMFLEEKFKKNINIYDENEIRKVIKPHFANLLNLNEGAVFQELSPNELVNSKRIDPLAKYVYVKFSEEGINSSWAKEVYLEHLRAFNEFIEGDGSNKSGIDAFVNAFNKLIKSIKEKGFDKNISVLPISENKELIEGSHRLGAALYFNKKVPTLAFKNAGWIYDYKFFVSKNLNQKYLDFLALQYLKFNRNLKIALLFPAAEGKEDVVKDILLKYGDIFYEKEVLFNKSGAELFLTQVYHDEEWLGTINNGFPGAKDKAGYCFNGNSSLRVFLFEKKKGINLTELKDEIREIYGIGKHSIHINDTFEETFLLANILFNKNSIDFLNSARLRGFTNFWNLFNNLLKEVNEKKIDTEKFCLTGSTTLSLLGIRDVSDIDYISFKDEKLNFSDEKISNHYTEKKYYHTSYDDIIFNPYNYFYFNGIKFASVDTIKKMKIKRAEEKDLRDVRLLNQFLESNDELNSYLNISEELIEKNELENAHQILTYLDIIFPKNSLVKNNLAIVEHRKGNNEKFFEEIIEALNINPENEIAKQNYLLLASLNNKPLTFASNSFPLVSVIIPVYNQAEFLPETVESVVNQTYRYWECLIINDGSTDNSAEVAQRLIEKYSDYNIKLYSKKNGGLADARNYGIERALGDYILPLDSDDLILPEMLKKTVSVLLANKNISIVGTDTLRFGEINNSYQTQGLKLEIMKYLDTLNYCSLYRKSVWKEVGGYNVNMVYGYEDWNFWISCAELGFQEKKVPEYLFKYRIRKNSMLTGSKQKDDILKARIILNHPKIYNKEEKEIALKILNSLDKSHMTEKEKKLFSGIK